MYSEIYGRFDRIENDISEVKNVISEVKNDISEIKNELLKTNMKIENNILPKLDAMFDLYKQNSEQLLRIENQIKMNRSY